MKKAIRNLTSEGRRDRLVLVTLTYAHNNFLTEHYLRKGLRAAATDYADVLLLGYFNKRPPQKLLDGALRLKELGLIRFVGLTTHNRKLVPELHREGLFDVIHFRYNAAHRSAEADIFPFVTNQETKDGERPGMVSFTATRWGKLLRANKMPAGEPPLTAAECYRFVLSNPGVDVCMMGAKNKEQMQENLRVLEQGPLTEQELERVWKIGDHVYGWRD